MYFFLKPKSVKMKNRNILNIDFLYLSGFASQLQRSEQRRPDFPQPSHLFQFIHSPNQPSQQEQQLHYKCLSDG